MDGVLRSWAVPKEPPLEPGVKRLAIPTEDHPISYASFEGTIPEGQYGAGSVEIWDSGTYDLINKDEEEIIFDLHGSRMNGVYVMIKTSGYGGNRDSWLLFKKKQNG
jgi:DNA ligase D-like protein (predicted 3'-phosphoesterase)